MNECALLNKRQLKHNFTVDIIVMLRLTSIFVFCYYFLGTFCLPQGDFSVMADLPSMYQHCKATEDKDMTPFDFVTDHLLNIDGLFDKHDDGDQQRPHAPFQVHHTTMQMFVVTPQNKVSVRNPNSRDYSIPFFAESVYPDGFSSLVFRPPIV